MCVGVCKQVGGCLLLFSFFSFSLICSLLFKAFHACLSLGALAMEALHRQVLPFLLRRMKEDVLKDLPPKIIQDYYCDLSHLQVRRRGGRGGGGRKRKGRRRGEGGERGGGGREEERMHFTEPNSPTYTYQTQLYEDFTKSQAKQELAVTLEGDGEEASGEGTHVFQVRFHSQMALHADQPNCCVF